MEDWEIKAREEIRELVARYNQAGDSGRFAAMLALFAEDARLEIEDAPDSPEQTGQPGRPERPGEIHRGRREIGALFAESARADGAPQRLRHFVASHQIDFESPLCARGRAYFMVLTPRGLDHWGLYRDEYQRAAEDAPWRFARRQVRVEGRTPGGWAARRRG